MEKKDKPFKGWECPRCKQINAPWVPYCDCKEEKSETITWGQNDHYNSWSTTSGAPLDQRIYTTVTSNAIQPNTITLDSAVANVIPTNTTLDAKGE